MLTALSPSDRGILFSTSSRHASRLRYETSYHRVVYRTSHHDQKHRELYELRYYRRMLELRYFVSTYFTDFALVLAAREQTSGLYNKDNLNELHFILNARTTRINEWLEDNQGHEDTQEFKLELRFHRDFLRATLTTRFTNPATAFGWSSLHMSYHPHPTYHD